MNQKKNFNRRDFINASAAASVAFTILPRHVLGGRGHIAPSDKLTLAYIGCGTQGRACSALYFRLEEGRYPVYFEQPIAETQPVERDSGSEHRY